MSALCFRNLNTIRSINRLHGHPVDRYTIMAQWSVEQLQFMIGILCAMYCNNLVRKICSAWNIGIL